MTTNTQEQACVACEGRPSPENTPCAVCGAGQPAASAEPVAWFIDWPDEPDLGHYLAEAPVDGARSRALVFHDAAPVAAQALPAENDERLTAASDYAHARVMHAKGRGSENDVKAKWDAFVRTLAVQAQPPAGWEWKLCPAGLGAETFVAAQQAPQGWKLVPETIPLAGLDAAIAWMRPAMNEAGRDLAYCLRGVWEILLESVNAPVAAEVQQDASLDSRIAADVAAVVETLDEGEWAEHIAKTELGQRLERHITQLVGRQQSETYSAPDAVLSDEQITQAMQCLTSEVGMEDEQVVINNVNGCIRALERAVLQKVAAKQDAAKVGAEPEMFWDDDDPERCQDSIHNVLVEVQCNRGLDVGDVVEVQRAIRLPNVSVRITAAEDEDGSGDLEYEVIDAARKEQK